MDFFVTITDEKDAIVCEKLKITRAQLLAVSNVIEVTTPGA